MSPDNRYLFVEYHEISSTDNSMLGKIAKFDLKTKKINQRKSRNGIWSWTVTFI
ncbi:hypothetical protein [Apilactobacillus ozensis]|uniref:hypothetical protein n=1 Tax=Apilactobacillus ozensis TaxID=866801 RepID=UPI0020936B4A|nr:hypothetical protein [Apilactobacillus ozensis]